MKAIALIPARYGATRFRGKLLTELKGIPVIVRTYEATLATGLFDEVVVVTDSEEIRAVVEQHGGKIMMSRSDHESGTDRIAEAAAGLNADVFLNVQGDTPFIKKEPLEKLLQQFEDENVQVGSLMQPLTNDEWIADPNFVKVCVDLNNNALFFSRSEIPYRRDKEAPVTFYEHIGVYAFRKKALLDFTRWQMTPLERAEKVECLRFLENGVPLRMVVTEYMGVEIDTPEDLQRAEKLL
ncbi:MAG: 3-deoxy-manno-octulosonate cytidylyltransferase [Flavisolibacter sp.]